LNIAARPRPGERKCRAIIIDERRACQADPADLVYS
jgi:hypothetical protein